MQKLLCFFFFIGSIICTSFICAVPSETLLLSKDQPSRIFINNRILAYVNGKAISVIDLVKKMDLLFYKQYPEYFSSAPARFQFYQMHWKNALQEMVDKELVLEDSQELKLPISHGDVRQEMENLFGPNIIVNLDKLGLTYSEAWKVVEEDMRLKRMIYLRANAKALRVITPHVIKEAYEEFAKKNIAPESWEYQSITMRHPKVEVVEKAAHFAYKYLQENGVSLANLKEVVLAEPSFKEVKISITDKLKQSTSELNPDNKLILTELRPGEYSKPIAQKSRRENSTVFRLFQLHAHNPEGAPPFNEVEMKLRDQLLNQASATETDAYLKRLRAHYHVDEHHFKAMSSDDFAPFALW